jgi:hypothetical protein
LLLSVALSHRSASGDLLTETASHSRSCTSGLVFVGLRMAEKFRREARLLRSPPFDPWQVFRPRAFVHARLALKALDARVH